MSASLTTEQVDILQHMLGLTDPASPNPNEYRDYYCASPGDPQLRELERLGMVRMYSDHGEYEWFTTTDAGKSVARARYMRDMQTKTKKQRVYLSWLRLSDVCPDLTFREFLTRPEFSERRRNA